MADLGTIERMKGILENKADKLELNMLSNIIDSKADRSLLSVHYPFIINHFIGICIIDRS